MFDEVKKLMTPQKNEKQRIIPFLGAGIYSSFLNHIEKEQFNHYKEEKILKILEKDLGLKDKNAKNFGRLALEIAFMLQQDSERNKNDVEMTERVPSGQELAQIMCEWVGNDAFLDYAHYLCRIFANEGIKIDITDLSSLLYDILKINGYYLYNPSLSSVSELFQKKYDRYLLWNNLHDLFRKFPEEPTDVHKKIAQKALDHINLNQDNSQNHYLVLTTNFDTLMESALAFKQLPYAVISTITTPGRKNYGKIKISFSGNIANKDKLEKECSNVKPKDFSIEYIKDLKTPIILIYKIHGCLNRKLTYEDDCLVISDSDYISFINRLFDVSRGAIPGFVNNEIQNKPLLFLGYSFRDWNIKSILLKTIEKGRRIKDFAVMNFVTDSEINILANEYKIAVIKTDVFDFMDKL